MHHKREYGCRLCAKHFTLVGAFLSVMQVRAALEVLRYQRLLQSN